MTLTDKCNASKLLLVVFHGRTGIGSAKEKINKWIFVTLIINQLHLYSASYAATARTSLSSRSAVISLHSWHRLKSHCPRFGRELERMQTNLLVHCVQDLLLYIDSVEARATLRGTLFLLLSRSIVKINPLKEWTLPESGKTK